MAIVVVMLASGCGTSASPTPAASPVTITLLEWQPKRAQVIESLLPQFEAETAAAGHPIKVRLEPLDLTDSAFKVELTARYRAGAGPDVTSYPTGWVPDFADKGFILDLTSRVDAWPDWAAHYYPILRQRATGPDGRVFAVPRGATVIQLFYRRDVLEANGVSTAQPRSWQELVDRMIQLRDRMQRPPILIPAGRSWGGGTFDEGFVNLMLGTTSQLYDQATGRWIVRSPGLTDVFRFYQTLTAERLLPVAPLLQPEPWQPTKYKTFPDGDLAVTTQGTWGWTFDWGPEGRMPIDDLADRVATWAFPTEAGGDPFVWAAEAWGWTVSRSSQHPDEAWQLVQWLSTGAPLAADLAAVGNLSPRDDISDVPPYRDQAHLVAEEKLIAIGRSFTPRVGIEYIQDAVGSATEDIIAGRLTGDQAADEFARLATQSLGVDRVEELPSSASP